MMMTKSAIEDINFLASIKDYNIPITEQSIAININKIDG